MSEWKPIDSAPKTGREVLIYYKNSCGKDRRIKAFYLTKFAEEVYGDYDGGDYCEEADTYYYEEGWWESVDNWGDLTFVKVHEGEPTHWCELPPPPKD